MVEISTAPMLPDAYTVIRDEVLILEHFEFGSSNNRSQKGSQQQISQDLIKKLDKMPFVKGTEYYHGKLTNK